MTMEELRGNKQQADDWNQMSLVQGKGGGTMPEKTIQIHSTLGISDERSEEISKKVITLLCETGKMDTGIRKLAEAYPAEALFAGMRLMQAVQMNAKLSKYKQDIRKQNADLN